MKKIYCSVAGLGRIGSSLEDDRLREKPATHTGAIVDNPRCVLLSGCDVDGERLRAFEKRWNCPNVFLSLDELIAFQRPDILCIATPPATHRELVAKAVDAGIPLVVCEKPLSEMIGEAEEIIGITSASETVLMVNHERRYSRDYGRVKKLIDGKRYGEVLGVHCRLFMGEGGSVREMLWEDGTHMIDMLRFFSGREVRVDAVRGDMRKKGGECVIILYLEGIHATIDAACNRDHLVFELDLHFPKGMIRIGNGVYEEYESVPSPYYEKMRSLRKKTGRFSGKTGYFSGMLADAVAVLNEKEKKRRPVSSGYDGYMAVRVIHDIVSFSKR
ncbi:MAG: Gfo/Idh/MocA family oxidoreductase [Spirochaetales bacterium]|nr:Gfo/Idh/MocA family oxidoreductase [Spirochaetales bacterium]